MSTTERKARKRERQEAGYPVKTRYQHPRKVSTPMEDRRSKPRSASRTVWYNRLMDLAREFEAAQSKKKKKRAPRKTRSQQFIDAQPNTLPSVTIVEKSSD